MIGTLLTLVTLAYFINRCVGGLNSAKSCKIWGYGKWQSFWFNGIDFVYTDSVVKRAGPLRRLCLFCTERFGSGLFGASNANWFSHVATCDVRAMAGKRSVMNADLAVAGHIFQKFHQISNARKRIRDLCFAEPKPKFSNVHWVNNKKYIEKPYRGLLL